MKCKHCKKEDKGNSNVCHYCGYLVDEKKADFDTFFTIEAFHFGMDSFKKLKKKNQLWEDYIYHVNRINNKIKQVKGKPKVKSKTTP